MIKSLKQEYNDLDIHSAYKLTETSSSLLGVLEQFKIFEASSMEIKPLILEDEFESLVIIGFLATSKKCLILK